MFCGGVKHAVKTFDVSVILLHSLCDFLIIGLPVRVLKPVGTEVFLLQSFGLDPRFALGIPVAFVIFAIASQPLFAGGEGKLVTTPFFEQALEFKNIRSIPRKNALHQNIRLDVLIKTTVGQVRTARQECVTITSCEEIELWMEQSLFFTKNSCVRRIVPQP